MSEAERQDATDREAVHYLMQKHSLGGTIEQHLVEYRAEKEKLELKRKRLRRLNNKEVQQYRKQGHMFVPMRMNPEYHKPDHDYPEGRSKMRWLVLGYMQTNTETNLCTRSKIYGDESL